MSDSKIVLTIKGENSNGKIAVNAEISNEMLSKIMRLLLSDDSAKTPSPKKYEAALGGGNP